MLGVLVYTARPRTPFHNRLIPPEMTWSSFSRRRRRRSRRPHRGRRGCWGSSVRPGRTSHARPGLRGFCVVIAALGLAASAWALQSPEDTQTGLQSAQPDPSAHLGRTPEQVRLSFGQAPATGSRSTVVVLGPQDENLARGPVALSSTAVSQRVAPLRERGAYQVSYEVQLVDGSVSRGQYWFWYAPKASASSSLLGSTELSALSLVAAAALLALALARRRTRRTIDAMSSSPVPAQRSRDHHEGVSPPGRRPRPSISAARKPQRTRPDRSRRL